MRLPTGPLGMASLWGRAPLVLRLGQLDLNYPSDQLLSPSQGF